MKATLVIVKNISNNSVEFIGVLKLTSTQIGAVAEFLRPNYICCFETENA